jgi:hypothetical protein
LSALAAFISTLTPLSLSHSFSTAATSKKNSLPLSLSEKRAEEIVEELIVVVDVVIALYKRN